MKFRPIATAALVGLAFASGSAQAATATTTFNVRITITAACDISTTAPTDVNFGTQPSTATAVDNQGALNVNCTPSSPYTISLDNGQNGTDAERSLFERDVRRCQLLIGAVDQLEQCRIAERRGDVRHEDVEISKDGEVRP